MWYSIKQGFKNLGQNKMFTAASILTVSAAIFLFCLFYSIVANVQAMVYTAETTVGITVFFDEDAADADKENIRDAIVKRGGVSRIEYVSSDQAWESFKSSYFGDESEELARAFADDNPLADSDSYELFLERIEDQQAEVAFIEGLPKVREVSFLNAAVSALKGLNRVLSALSVAVTGVLGVVAVFLISNTIRTAAEFRKRENEIMKLIGATNFMIRAPFVVEGTMIGLLGALIPLAGFSELYRRTAETFTQKIAASAGGIKLAGIVHMVPVEQMFPVMLLAGAVLGVGIGFIVSFITIRKHLKV